MEKCVVMETKEERLNNFCIAVHLQRCRLTMNSGPGTTITMPWEPHIVDGPLSLDTRYSPHSRNGFSSQTPDAGLSDCI